jgi:hypothetical protein
MASAAHRTLLLAVIPISPLFLFAACTPPEVAEGPGVDPHIPVVKIIVENLRSGELSQTVVTKQEKIRSALPIFSTVGWQKSDGELVPQYRVQLFTPAGSRLIYWIGTFSQPPRFPCYWFCSGYWLASSDAAGHLNPSTYKSLASSGATFAVGDLLRPSSTGTQ